MEPFDNNRNRKRKNPFDFISDDEFEKIFDEMQKIFEQNNFKDIIEDIIKNGMEPNKRFIHGFSINLGPDGKPHIQEFGNKPKKTPQGTARISDEQEPLSDIIEGESDVAITVELPGVEKDNIDLNVTDTILNIHVADPQRKYHKTIDLPCDVKPKTTKATYKNGILDIVLKKKDPGKPDGGYRVTIE